MSRVPQPTLARMMAAAGRTVDQAIRRVALARSGRFRTRAQRVQAVRRMPGHNPKVLHTDRTLRDEARRVYQRVYGSRPVEVHHRIPLEWRYLFPRADPNRLANLQGLSTAAHRRKASDMWDAFRFAHQRDGREPLPAEVLRHAGLVDRSLNLPYPL